MATLLKLARIHPLEQVQIFLNGAVTVRAVGAGSGGSALLLGNLLTRLVVNVGLTLLDQADGEVVQFGEVVTGIVQTVAPVITQPMNVAFNGLNILGVLLLGLVSSKRRLHVPPNFSATPKSMQIALA